MAPRPLPFELIDHIFAQDVLADADLAACCLVSQDFLPIARRWLYLVYSVNILWQLGSGSDENIETWQPKSKMHFQSLKAHPHLATLVRQVKLDNLDEVEPGELGLTELISRDEVSRTVLELLAPVQAVDSRLDLATSYVKYLAKHRAILREVRGIELSTESFDFLAGCPNLSLLEVAWLWERDPTGTLTIPLRVLSVGTGPEKSLSSNAFSRLAAASHATLTTLRIAFNGSVRLDLSPFTALHNLWIDCQSKRRARLTSSALDPYLRDLASLISSAHTAQVLTLAPFWTKDVLFTDSTIADALPPSLRRLDVLHFFPLHAVDYLTAPSCSARLSIIGTCPTRGQHFAELFTLTRHCAEKGIELVMAREDFFGAAENLGERLKGWFDENRKW
ncbi:hypothetical protein JCM10207_004529 [Rhodosporidiobolus poonsookiae]